MLSIICILLGIITILIGLNNASELKNMLFHHKNQIKPLDRNIVMGSLETFFVKNDEARTDFPAYTKAINECTTDQFVVLVMVRPYGFEQRERMRKMPMLSKRAQMYFIIGTTNEFDYNEESEDRLLKEIQMEKDIVRIDNVDSYQTTRIKSLMRITYFVDHCEHSPYALFVDDDTNPDFTLVEYQSWSQNDDINCLKNVWRKAGAVRSKSSRFYASPEEYPFNLYPDYCSGPCYSMNKRAAKKLYKEIKYRSYSIHNAADDVYVTGILRTLASVGIQETKGVCENHIDAGDSEENLRGRRETK